MCRSMSLSGSMREGQAASELTLKEACNGQCCSHAAQLLEARLVPREVSAQCASLSVLALRRHTVHCNNVRITTQIWVKNTTQIWISPFACGALIKMKLLLGGGPAGILESLKIAKIQVKVLYDFTTQARLTRTRGPAREQIYRRIG